MKKYFLPPLVISEALFGSFIFSQAVKLLLLLPLSASLVFGLKCKVFNQIQSRLNCVSPSVRAVRPTAASLCLCGCRARTLEKQSDNMRPVCFHRGQTSARRHRASVRGTDIIHTPE